MSSKMVRLGCLLVGLVSGCGKTSPVFDTPFAGQALISGTDQTFRWHGGSAGERYDIQFVSSRGAVLTLASGLADSGSTDVHLSLSSDDARAGGTLRLVSSAASTGQAQAALGMTQQGLDVAPGESSASPAVKVGSLAAFGWTGTVEEYYWLDVVTGDKKTVGTVGDLKLWSLKTLAVDHDAGQILILGFPDLAATQQTLYVLDAKSGALTRQVPVPNVTYTGLLVTKDHRLLGFGWNATSMKEEVTQIDTTTGTTKLLGTVGDLAQWSDQSAYDPASDTIYVLGYAASAPSTSRLYVLNATSGALVRQVNLSTNNVLGMILNSAGTLYGFHFNNLGSMMGGQEEMLRIDPLTGTTTVVGTVGDLTSWSTVARINRTNDLVYVIGQDGAGQSKLYMLDGKTGSLIKTTPTAAYPTDAELIY